MMSRSLERPLKDVALELRCEGWEGLLVLSAPIIN